MSAKLLSVSDLHKRYAVPVLQGVNFDVAPGQVHALVGANGAGKTTFLSILGGTVSKTSGLVNVWGFGLKVLYNYQGRPVILVVRLF